MRQLLSLLFFFHTLPSILMAMSLEEAIKKSLSEHPEIQSSKSQLESAQSEMRSSYGKFLPQINLEGRHTHLNQPIELDMNSIRSAMILSDTKVFQTSVPGATAPQVALFNAGLQRAIPEFKMKVQEQDYNNLSANLLWPLYTGGKLTANMGAKSEEYEISRIQDKGTHDRIIGDVVTNYMRVQFMRGLVQIRQDVLSGLHQHLQNAEKLLKQGVISLANKLRVEVALAEADREKKKAESDLELSELLLKNSLGGVDEVSQLTTPLFSVNKIPLLEKMVDEGLSGNMNLQILEHRQAQLDHKVDAVASDFLPTLAAFGKYELYRHDLTLLEPEWAIGVALKFNLFDGGQDYFNLQSARAQRRAVASFSQSAKDLIRTEIEKNHHDLITATEQLKALEASLRLAEENLRLNRLSFSQGVATSLEVIDAQLALGKVRTEQKKALFDCDVALISLLRSVGKAETILDYTSSSKES